MDSSPIARVTAKPLTVPELKKNRIAAVIIAARCVSIRVRKTRWNPAVVADAADFPSFISSRIRSKISTFESMPTPIVRTIPAIPGNVRIA